jgi:acyl-CoA thioesterase I
MRYGALVLIVNVLMLFSGLSAMAEPARIVVLGDSLAAGYGLPAADSFPARLQAALRMNGADVEVINAGVSGDTTAGGRSRLDWALAPGPDGPARALIVELGANDGLRGLDPKASEANLDAILGVAVSRGVKVLLAGMLAPPNLGREYSEEFKAVYPRLAQKHGVALYPFFLEGVAARPELNQRDGIHPNADGVEVIVERILPHVERLLAKP